jgi:glycine dehydrogenase subunit 2
MESQYLLKGISKPGRAGVSLPEPDVDIAELPSHELLRDRIGLPEVSEVDLVRYFTALSKLNYSLDAGFYPLGSCTMKYNPKWHEDIAAIPGFSELHPYQPASTVQGALQVIYELQGLLGEITGMAGTSLLPMAGAHGEMANLLMVRAYHHSKGEAQRRIVLVPDSAHGTNPATAAMCGFEIKTIASDADGNVDIESLKSLLDWNIAALTLTLPTTLGLFDPHILEIHNLVHGAGALLCGDGANLNSIIGKVKFGDLGIDCVQLNLHKTFSTPHGGGGPGAGPVCVSDLLTEYLPSPLVVKEADSYQFVTPANSIGSLGAAYGNFGVMIKAYAYLRSLGAAGLKSVSENAVINANYIKEQLKADYYLPYDRHCMHEVVFSGKRQQARGVSTMDIAKRLLDYGIHPPTVYFPLIVDQALMIEPTETESLETVDAYITAMKEIARDAVENPDLLHAAPHSTPVRRLDEVAATRNPNLRWTWD